MAKDECILVDEQDRITGHANKYQSHRFVVAGAWRVLEGAGGCGCRRLWVLGRWRLWVLGAGAAAVGGGGDAGVPRVCARADASWSGW